MTHTGNCPKCGAAIWSCPKPGDPNAIPETVFTCPCHKWLQLQEVKSLPYTFIPYQQPTWQQPLWNPFIWYDGPVNTPPVTVYSSGCLQTASSPNSVNTR